MYLINTNKLSAVILILTLFSSSISCSDNATGNLGTKNTQFVSRKIYNAQLMMTDSIYTVIKLRAPVIEEYEYAKTPYTVFPKGLDMDFYEKGKTNPGHLRADYAKIIERTGWYEARKNVVIINSDKDTLKTNQIFWDKQTRKIFTHDTVRIYRADGLTTNISFKGIEATEDFKNFKLRQNIGTLPYKNELKK